MARRKKKTARRPRGTAFLSYLQTRILLPFLMMWLAVLSLFGGGIDPNFP
jgi:hypothetical protein